MPAKLETVFSKRVVTVALTRTINTGNYESVKVMAGFSSTIPDNADLDTAYNEAWDIASEELDGYIEDIGLRGRR